MAAMNWRCLTYDTYATSLYASANMERNKLHNDDGQDFALNESNEGLTDLWWVH